MALNKNEVQAYEERTKKDGQQKGRDPNAVRPRISLLACLSSNFQPEEISNFYSPAIKAKTTAIKSSAFQTFPKYLVIQIRKFTISEDWTPVKLDVLIEVPKVLDLGEYRARGIQPGEELLPDDKSPSQPDLQVDESLVAQLMEMGFPAEGCRKAVINTRNQGIEAGMNWIIEHMGDPDFAVPAQPKTPHAKKCDPVDVATLVSMGFSEKQATQALQATDNNLERATDWIFNHLEDLEESPASAPLQENTSLPPPNDQSSTKYELFAFISHIGSSTHSGHYVCHILKEGQWVQVNDNKVVVSEQPPIEMGYLYFYRQL